MATAADKMSAKEKEEAIAAFQALGVCTQLAEAAAGLGWKKPSSIQTEAVPHLLAGRCARAMEQPCWGAHACMKAAGQQEGSSTTQL